MNRLRIFFHHAILEISERDIECESDDICLRREDIAGCDFASFGAARVESAMTEHDRKIFLPWPQKRSSGV